MRTLCGRGDLAVLFSLAVACGASMSAGDAAPSDPPDADPGRADTRGSVDAGARVDQKVAVDRAAPAEAPSDGQPSPAPWEAPYRFLVLADLHENSSYIAKAMNEVAGRYAPKLVISAGDNTGHGLRKGSYFWPALEALMKGANVRGLPYHTMMGNHDYCGDTGPLFGSGPSGYLMKDHVWSHRATTPSGETIAFIYVDTNPLAYAGCRGKDSCRWLDDSCGNLWKEFDARKLSVDGIVARAAAELDANRDADYVFMFGHHPIGGGFCGADGDTGKLKALISRHRVSAYFFGHVHAIGHARDGDVLHVCAGRAGQIGRACSDGRVLVDGDKQIFGFVVAEVRPRASGAAGARELSVHFFNQDAAQIAEVTHPLSKRSGQPAR